MGFFIDKFVFICNIYIVHDLKDSYYLHPENPLRGSEVKPI